MNSDRETGTGNTQLDTDFSWDCLARAREEKELSIEDVARKLKITESYVAALEKGDFKQFPAAAFARGYIKKYAKLLELDGDALAARIDDSAPVVSRDRLGFGHKPDRSSVRSSSLIRYTATLVSVVLIALVSYFWWDGSQEDASPAVSPENAVAVVESTVAASEEGAADKKAEPEPSVTSPSPEEKAVDTAQQVTETPDADHTEEAGVPAETTAENQDTPEAEAAVASAGVVKHSPPLLERTHLYIRFKEDCWLEIKDMSGNVITAGLNKAGSELDMEIPSAVKVRLGNAPGVELIKFAGETIDMSAQPLRKGKKVAKLTLNAYEQS